MNKVRLNNFILWCKGWYECINDKDMFDQAADMLKLDGYICLSKKKCNWYCIKLYRYI